jgi:nicotinamide mononucleotide adenylyltransferase
MMARTFTMARNAFDQFKKSQIVIYDKQVVPEDDKVYCVWGLAGRILKEVDAYKYLGVFFQSDGLWNVTIDSNMLRSRNTLGELIQASFGDYGLQVGHNARLPISMMRNASTSIRCRNFDNEQDDNKESRNPPS